MSNNMVTLTHEQFRDYLRLARKERNAKLRKVEREARKAYWRTSYWAQALRFETFKIGGLRFIKLGRLSLSICMTRPEGH